MNLCCTCNRFCVHPRPCLHVNLPHVSKHLFPPLFPCACLCFHDPPWPCPQVNLLYIRALTPTHVPPAFRQSGSRPRQLAWPITGLTTRVFRCPFLLPTPRVIEYSDDVVFLFHPPHLSHHLPAPLPDNFIMIVIVVSVWVVVFMLSEAHTPR